MYQWKSCLSWETPTNEFLKSAAISNFHRYSTHGGSKAFRLNHLATVVVVFVVVVVVFVVVVVVVVVLVIVELDSSSSNL